MCYEDAIEYFKCFSITQTAFRKDVYGTVIKAMEKQIPASPITKFYCGQVAVYVCPICEYQVCIKLDNGEILSGAKHNYCPKCGQAIKWGG